jgi:hypothetical protein
MSRGRIWSAGLCVTGPRLASLSLLLTLATACDGDGGSQKGDAGEAGNDGGNMMGQPGDGGGNKDAGNGGPGNGDGGSDPGRDAGPLCAGNCDDGNSCTTDECVAAGVCTHELTPGLCMADESCHPMKGCVKGNACSMPSDCVDDDGCTTNERCDAELARCHFEPLDRDDDGAAPASCGGGDCNDNNPRVGPGQDELCNGQDDDCDGTVDEQAECPGEGQVCMEGMCRCPEGLTQCGGGRGVCANLQTDRRFCGECNNNCGPAGVCNQGECTCPAPGTQCGDSCVDTNYSFQHCGGCGMACDLNPLEACVNGDCGACGGNGQACCQALGGALDGCYGALTCKGTASTAGAVCECASPNVMCGEDCTDPTTSEEHCGGCGTACEEGENCLDSGSGPKCTACGAVGEPCCDFNGLRFCLGGGGPGGGGGASCNQTTMMCQAGGGGGGGGGPGGG